MQAVTIGENQSGQRLDKFLHKYAKYVGVAYSNVLTICHNNIIRNVWIIKSAFFYIHQC